MIKNIKVTYRNRALGATYTIATELSKGESAGEVAYGRLHRTACAVQNWNPIDVTAKWM